KRGACVAEREIQAVRGSSGQLQAREKQLEEESVNRRSQMLSAEQQREDAQRALYLAHRSVSELAGQRQSQQGRLDSARDRLTRIDAELAQLAETIDASGAQARDARSRLEDLVARMAELESGPQALEAERRGLVEARDAARDAARASREAAHA